MQAVVISLCFLYVASARIVSNSQDVNETSFLPESVCRDEAYAFATHCVSYGSMDDSESKSQDCLADVTNKYFDCMYGSSSHKLDGESRRALSSAVRTTLLAGKMTLPQIKCIVDNILDLIRCVVDGQLVDDVPFKWNWKSFTKCVVQNIPTYLDCIQT